MPDINPAGSAASGISKPRVKMLVNGTPIKGVVQVSVTSNNYYRADEWSASVLPDAETTWNLATWFPTDQSATPPMVEIQGYDEAAGPGTTSWIIGRCDKQVWNPITGALEISGRDRTADFIEAKTSETFKNQTASQVAQTLAARHGLTAQVTPTTTLVSRFYETDHDKISFDSFSRATTEWDLLTSLAQNEGFDCFVRGTTLYFQKPTPPSADAWAVRMDRAGTNVTANCIDLTFEHNLLAKDILVRLRSWNSRQGAGFEVTAPPGVSSGSVRGGKATQYVFRRPNLQRDQAQAQANALYADLAKHEMRVKASWPYMTGVTARDLLRVQGVGANLDATYFLTEIERTLSFDGGYMETVEACNQQPTVQASIG